MWRNGIFWGVFVAAMFCAGCANPVRPLPPSLRLPEPAKRLTAERVGDEVRLAWTTGPNTTDGERVHGAMTAVVCREMPPPTAGCRAISKAAVIVGPSAAVEKLPANLAVGPPVLLAYRVELLNDQGRSDGVSDPVFAAGGAAPAAAGYLSLTPEREAVLVRWSPKGATAAMEVRRTLTNSPAAGRAGLTAATSEHGKAPAMFGAKSTTTTEVLLRAEGADTGKADQPDAGGLLDKSVRDGEAYTYVAQRVQVVTLAGHRLELRGEISPAASLAYQDVFPPQTPAGLVAVPGEGLKQRGSIDLAWEAGAEDDLLGYNVYRRENGGEFVRLNAEPVASPAYRDLKVEHGHSYTYRVTAVDQRHHESGPSTEIRESLRQ